MSTDPISDFLTIIRNASRAGKQSCLGKYSKVHLRIAEILRDEGFVRQVDVKEDERGHKHLEISLKFMEDTPAITELKRDSRPGRRVYYKHNEIPRVLGGLGVGILTTSQGIMRDREARRQKVGGELICSVW